MRHLIAIAAIAATNDALVDQGVFARGEVRKHQAVMPAGGRALE